MGGDPQSNLGGSLKYWSPHECRRVLGVSQGVFAALLKGDEAE